MKRIGWGSVILLTLPAGEMLRGQSDPFLGTWKLNVKKSKFDRGPALKSETRIVVTGPTGMNVSVKRVKNNDAKQEFEYTTNLDGKSYPITGEGPEGADTIAANLTGSNTMQITLTKNRKVKGAATITVSGDFTNA